jgi:hypothetical protein
MIRPVVNEFSEENENNMKEKITFSRIDKSSLPQSASNIGKRSIASRFPPIHVTKLPITSAKLNKTSSSSFNNS